jgi:hypothetical protein
MKKHRVNLNLQCDGNIDWMRQGQNADYRTKVKVASKYTQNKFNSGPGKYCKEYSFFDKNAQDIKPPVVYKTKDQCTKNVPLINTVPKGEKQYAFGRISNLRPYYECPSFFYGLLNDKWTIEENDMFVYCSQMSKQYDQNKFNIRIVLSKGTGIEDRDRKTGLIPYLDVQKIGSYHENQNYVHTVILAREMCQMLAVFKLSLYMSKTHPEILFAKHAGLPVNLKRFIPVEFAQL